MSSHNDFIIEILNFLLNSDLTIMYKKVVIKKYINEYLNDNNKDELMNIIKNNNQEIYDYIFLERYDKKRQNYHQILERQKKYNEAHKEELKEKRKLYYQKHKEEKLQKVKEYQLKKKEINNNQNE